MDWMTPDIIALAVTAASIGLLHTAIGPDHYLPFVVLSRARRWSARRTALITTACGLVHVAGSVALGLLGVAAGLALQKLNVIESFRGDLAAWALLSFGLVYLVWGLRQAYRRRAHSHWHHHADGRAHDHQHDHQRDHAHLHASGEGRRLTPWALFLIFAFGPCEALIPVLMYPAAAANTSGLVFVTIVFAVTTIATMLTLTLFGRWGLANFASSGHVSAALDRHAHSLAGAAIAVCACLMLVGL